MCAEGGCGCVCVEGGCGGSCVCVEGGCGCVGVCGGRVWVCKCVGGVVRVCVCVWREGVGVLLLLGVWRVRYYRILTCPAAAEGGGRGGAPARGPVLPAAHGADPQQGPGETCPAKPRQVSCERLLQPRSRWLRSLRTGPAVQPSPSTWCT